MHMAPFQDQFKMEEKRKHDRKDCRGVSVVMRRLDGNSDFDIHDVINLSYDGILLSNPSGLIEDEYVALTFDVLNPGCMDMIKCLARVRRISSKNGAALQFVRINIDDLRRLESLLSGN
jgi:hypothetical protein